MPKLSYKYRIEPNKVQVAALSDMLRDFCGICNAGLQQRIEAYQRRHVCVSYKMQADELKATRLGVASGRLPGASAGPRHARSASPRWRSITPVSPTGGATTLTTSPADWSNGSAGSG